MSDGEIFYNISAGGLVMRRDKPELVKVTVTIFGEEYTIKGDEKPEYIEMIASYVDRKMHAISQRSPNLTITKVAVLTALNLADELSKLQEDYDELVRTLEEARSNRTG